MRSKPLKPAFERKVPPGDDHERDVCRRCDFIDYKNPKIVVGSVCSFDGRILLCRRAIEPRLGFWTLPAGFLEIGETVEDGARREAWEEARIRPVIDQLLAVYSVPRISQVQVMFRARLESADCAPGRESLEVALFEWDDLPWENIAFPTVGWALRQWRTTRNEASFAPFTNPVDGL